MRSRQDRIKFLNETAGIVRRLKHGSEAGVPMTKTGRIIVSVGLAVYAIAVLLSIIRVLWHGVYYGNALSGVVLTLPWSLAWVCVTNDQYLLIVLGTLAGGLINGTLFFFLVRLLTRSKPRV
jgi:hypothetical protein